MNFAVGGSTVDKTIVPPFMLGSNLQEEAELFVAAFAGNESRLDWKADNSVMIFWFGVNDVIGSNEKENVPGVFARIFESYAASVGMLYDAGARNFLFLTVPPFIRADRADHDDDLFIYTGRLHSEINEHEHTTSFNAHIEQLRTDLRGNHSDASAAIFDSQRFFVEVLEQPRRWSQMDGVSDTEIVCNGIQDYDVPYYEQICSDGKLLGAHAWIPIHATYPVHNATAAQVAQDCFAVGGWTGFCI